MKVRIFKYLKYDAWTKTLRQFSGDCRQIRWVINTALTEVKTA